MHSDEEFHLSIKNNLRKIGDVRDLFKDLTPYEKDVLEFNKIRAEKLKQAQLEAQLANDTMESIANNISSTTSNNMSTSSIQKSSDNSGVKREKTSDNEINVSKKNKTDDTNGKQNVPSKKFSILIGNKLKNRHNLPAKTVNFNENNLYYTNSHNDTYLNETDEKLAHLESNRAEIKRCFNQERGYYQQHHPNLKSFKQQPSLQPRAEYFLRSFTKKPNGIHFETNKVNHVFNTNKTPANIHPSKYSTAQQINEFFTKNSYRQQCQPNLYSQIKMDASTKSKMYSNQIYNNLAFNNSKSKNIHKEKPVNKFKDDNLIIANGNNYNFKRSPITSENFNNNNSTYCHIKSQVYSKHLLDIQMAASNQFYNKSLFATPGNNKLNTFITKTKHYIF